MSQLQNACGIPQLPLLKYKHPSFILNKGGRMVSFPFKKIVVENQVYCQTGTGPDSTL